MSRAPVLSEATFRQLVERHRSELRLHCYRMLGSSHDSEDVVQDAVLRAWRAKDALEDASKARAWLYRIATNACLDELGRRRSRGVPWEAGPPSEPSEQPGPYDHEAWIEPFPSTWLSGLASDPAARYEVREAVTLAFVAAIHHLTASQRATLLLRDVVGLSAEETAKALGASVEAVNSALFRARNALEEKLPGEGELVRAEASVDEALLRRYMRAWDEVDVDAFVAMLHDDVRTSMPPAAMWLEGRDVNAAFYAAMFAKRPVGFIRSLRTGANGGPALAFYRRTSASDPLELRAIQAVGFQGGKVARIDHFMLPELATIFAVPRVLADDVRATIA